MEERNMFDVNDKETVMKLINTKKNDELIVPIYVRVGKETYSLIDIHDIPDCSPSIFKVGFGSCNSVFNRLKFPNDKLVYFSDVSLFTHFDEDKQTAIQYITFESSDMEDDGDILIQNINKYYDMLLDYTMNIVSNTKKERIKKVMEELS